MHKVFIETYGCQMNIADTEIVSGILIKNGYDLTKEMSEADIVLLNTCSIRENAEQRIYGRLGNIKHSKTPNKGLVLGILGCMAERLKDELIKDKKVIDLVVGPDEYRRLPELIDIALNGNKGIGVRLSRTETYDDIVPYREEGISAWISVMRGCDKFCTYCVVPFTRGRERSRSLTSIVEEVSELSKRGFKEIHLLGQNVNSYLDADNDFADLLDACAKVDPKMRVRFTTSHPQDLSDKLLQVIAQNNNICKYIHLPVQSGSNRILELMNRTYTVEHYLDLIERAKKLMPNITFSTDVIAGFPTETEEDHKKTIEVMNKVQYDGAYMFKYSPREGTKAYKMVDDVPEDVKGRRLQEIVDLQQNICLRKNLEAIGTIENVLIEGTSKKSEDFLSGRTDSNKIVVFKREPHLKEGDYVDVKITKATSGTLLGEIVIG